MRFTGRTWTRTKGVSTPDKAPSESDIQKLNPQRVAGILQATGWAQLATGTLNLIVKEHVHAELWDKPHAYEECGKDITYPDAAAWIPLERISYRYYLGKIRFGSKSEDILARIAQVPANRTFVELFSENKLRVALSSSATIPLPDGVEVDVVVFHTIIEGRATATL